MQEFFSMVNNVYRAFLRALISLNSVLPLDLMYELKQFYIFSICQEDLSQELLIEKTLKID